MYTDIYDDIIVMDMNVGGSSWCKAACSDKTKQSQLVEDGLKMSQRSHNEARPSMSPWSRAEEVRTFIPPPPAPQNKSIQ